MAQDFYRNIVFKKTKPKVTPSSSEESLPKNISDNSSKEKRTEMDEIKLSSRSKYLHLKNYLYFRCEDCDYNTKNGQDFERHLFQHDEETQLEADATFCFEIEEKNGKIKEEKEKVEPFKLSSIIETNESQDLLEQSSE